METIKEEKKADLEQLLNSLIEKGRVPFGEKEIKDIKILKTKDKRWNFVCQIPGGISKHCTYRELVSKESGLWQFVCENEMIKLKFGDRRHYNTDNYRDKICLDCNYPYWLMEASLKDESELENFILDNIKVDVESN